MRINRANPYAFVYLHILVSDLTACKQSGKQKLTALQTPSPGPGPKRRCLRNQRHFEAAKVRRMQVLR